MQQRIQKMLLPEPDGHDKVLDSHKRIVRCQVAIRIPYLRICISSPASCVGWI